MISGRRGPRAIVALSLPLLLLALASPAPANAAAGLTPATEDAKVRAPETLLLVDTRPAPEPKAAPALPSERLGFDLSGTPAVMLPEIDVAQLLREDEEQGLGGNKGALRIGLGRDIAPAAITALDGNWFDAGGGARLWAVEVGAAGALGLRLHFRDVALPPGAELAVYSPSDLLPRSQRVEGPTEGVSRVERYGAAAPRELWTATLAGERARIEYFAPAGAPAGLPFTVDRLQHVYRDPIAGVIATKEGGVKAAGSCNNDVTCFPDWAATANAVAGIGFVNTNFLYCSGQLINSQKPDFTPYWLTANHCLSTQESAASSEFFWFYQTATCGGPPPALTSVPRSAGASLLSTSGISDYTLMLIEGALPGGLTWAGWTSAKLPDGTPSTVIHHPQGDYKRISFGNKGSNDVCGSSNLVRVNWTDGPTEPGSSGSGIYTDAKQQLYGQLFFGPSACDNETYDCFGAFSTTYTKVKNFLKNGGSDDNSEQNDTCAKARGVKAGTLRGRIVKSVDSDWYRFAIPGGKTATITASFPNWAGDIDLKVFANCKSDALAASEGQGDEESITVTNVGKKPATVYWQVYLFSDVRNGYDLSVSLQ